MCTEKRNGLEQALYNNQLELVLHTIDSCIGVVEDYRAKLIDSVSLGDGEYFTTEAIERLEKLKLGLTKN